MSRNKAAFIASVLAMALVAAPISSAFANGRHYGGYGGYGGYYGGALALGLAGAVVGTAAALITAPFALARSGSAAPVYYAGPAPAYPVATRYYGAPVAPAYYGPSVASAYYGPPVAPAYYAPPTASFYYGAPVAPVYYAPPLRSAYYAPRPAYYSPRPAYRGPPMRYYAAPGPRYYYGR